MNFFELYLAIPNNLEKRKIRNAIINACLIQHSTFYRWLAKREIPPLSQRVISDVLKKSQEELFPKKESEAIIN